MPKSQCTWTRLWPMYGPIIAMLWETVFDPLLLLGCMAWEHVSMLYGSLPCARVGGWSMCLTHNGKNYCCRFVDCQNVNCHLVGESRSGLFLIWTFGGALSAISLGQDQSPKSEVQTLLWVERCVGFQIISYFGLSGILNADGWSGQKVTGSHLEVRRRWRGTLTRGIGGMYTPLWNRTITPVFTGREAYPNQKLLGCPLLSKIKCQPKLNLSKQNQTESNQTKLNCCQGQHWWILVEKWTFQHHARGR